MNQPDPLQPGPLPQRLQTLWAQALASLLLSLGAFVLGWQLSEQGHSRLLSASQTSPALPELRPAPAPQSAPQGVGALSEPPFAPPSPGWTAVARPLRPPVHLMATDLTALGRLNLDGG
ncbi:hypothetical protein [Deinococcus sp.]|uniref:hypothetical protein n=1 Tax=Deinococcus sp. TaxID=47478 RepID=UPI003C7A63F6